VKVVDSESKVEGEYVVAEPMQVVNDESDMNKFLNDISSVYNGGGEREIIIQILFSHIDT